MLRILLLVIKMKDKNKKIKQAKKSAGDNQWTSNNLKYYPDTRERKDGPGGENVKQGQQ